MSKKFPIGGLVALGAAATLIVFAAGSWISAANAGAEQEAGLIATLDNNKQILATYSNTIGEMAQIPAMQRDNLVTVLDAAFQGRYGPDGSQAVFQMINENYPGTLDNALYQNIQNAIVSGRTDFRQNQTVLLDKKRVYTVMLNKPWSGFWLKMAGYPKTDLSKIIAVTNSHSDAAFAKGQDNGLTIGNPPPVVRKRETPVEAAASN